MLQQLLIHVWGDYVFQSDWMAMNKSKKSIPCLVHVILYTAMFLFLTFSWKALLIIGGTHYIIDRYPIILKRIIWLKNHMNPQFKYVPFKYCDTTGYYDNSIYNTSRGGEAAGYGKPRLFEVTIWLYIITDNLFHLTINYLALKYL